ncbi:CitMHS family transporter [Brevundimonas sp.]|uniref:CitMHS family transporter n=1 Tax=Brevundimonas sp. TaxID=1871086 RepID=UPI0025BAA7D8|nr:CitMHS family transporter [Brevundimonas sp.]
MTDSSVILTLLGFGMVATFMALIMMRRLSPLVALTLVPIVFALLAGFGGQELGKMMLEGIIKLAPTGVMLMFAILYFGLMIDAGLFDPVVRQILKLVGNDPLKIVLGSAILAAFVSLDGDGSTTYMICIASMLPLYKRLGMNPLKLTCVTILASGVMNLTPWGGPLARAASALHIDPAEVFVPMIPAMTIGVLGVFAIALWLGRAERRRLGYVRLAPAPLGFDAQFLTGDSAETVAAGGGLAAGAVQTSNLRRPRLLWVNALLTTVLMVCLILGVMPLPVLFMAAFSIALLINYPKLEEQRQRISEHARNVIAVVSLIFAAGVFTGILSGTGMVTAMSQSLIAVIPAQAGPYLAPITALVSMPFTFFMSNDAFYFGVLPVVSEAAGAYGVTPVEMARASLIGQPVHLLSPLVPSTYLLVGLAGVEFGEHQKFTMLWAVLICLLLMTAALMLGLFPFAA